MRRILNNKRRQLNKKLIPKFSLSKLFFACVITTIIAVSLSLSKYKTTVVLHESAKVAIMANDVIVNLGDNITGYPGSQEDIYPIEVTNKEDNVICQVAQKFNITIKKDSEQNLPLTFKLFEDKDCTKPLQDDGNGFYENDKFTFMAGEEEHKIYYLKVTWPANVNTENYAFEIDYFKLNVHITQVD